MDWMLVAAGALTGLLVGLTGVGGGALMTPLLLLVFGVAPWRLWEPICGLQQSPSFLQPGFTTATV